jgi:hypothetical protein
MSVTITPEKCTPFRIDAQGCNIIQIDKSTFKIQFDYPNPSLINSIIRTKLIIGATATDDYTHIRFKAQTIKSLPEFLQGKKLSIAESAKLTENLAMQLQYLIESESYTILGYNKENIIVINDKTFAYLGSELITKIEDNEQVLISSPFSTTDFFVSPELQKITSLPAYVHYKTTYFSLACLVIYGLLSSDQFYYNYLLDPLKTSEIIKCLDTHPIKHTKLYWLLSRCLGEEPEKRSIIHL